MLDKDDLPGLSTIDLLQKNVAALKEVASRLLAESKKARNRAKLGRRVGYYPRRNYHGSWCCSYDFWHNQRCDVASWSFSLFWATCFDQ